MTAALALASALMIGASDFVGGVASRRWAALPVVVWTQVSSLAVALAAALAVTTSEVTATDLAMGAIAGASGGFSFAAFYSALTTGAMSRVAPVTALVGAVVPLLVGVALGEALAPLTWAGVLLAVVAIGLVSRGPDGPGGGGGPRPIFLAAVAGLGFSAFFVALAQTSSDAGVVPLIAARLISLPLVGLAVAAQGGVAALKPRREVVPLTVVAGASEMLANLLILAALQRGPLAVASVLGSLYPISTVFLARWRLGERLMRSQMAGVAVALVALPLVAAG